MAGNDSEDPSLGSVRFDSVRRELLTLADSLEIIRSVVEEGLVQRAGEEKTKGKEKGGIKKNRKR